VGKVMGARIRESETDGAFVILGARSWGGDVEAMRARCARKGGGGGSHLRNDVGEG
jgi:hypothetical protein